MSLLGRLEDLSLTDIVQIVFLSRRTGVLEIIDGGGRHTVMFRHGLVVNASAPDHPDLTTFLYNRGTLMSEDVRTIRQMEDQGMPCGTAVLELNLMEQENLAEAIRERVLGVIAPLLHSREGEFNFILSEGMSLVDIEYDPDTILKDGGLPPQKLIGIADGEKIKPLRGLEESIKAGRALTRGAAPPQQGLDLGLGSAASPDPSPQSPEEVDLVEPAAWGIETDNTSTNKFKVSGGLFDIESPEAAYRNVVLFERDPLVRVAAKRAFGKIGAKIFQFGSLDDARGAMTELFRSNSYFVTFLELTEDGAAERMMQQLKRRNPRLPIVVIDRDPDLRRRHALLKSGADLYVTRPPRERMQPETAQEELALFAEELVLFAERAFQQWEQLSGKFGAEAGKQFYAIGQKENVDRSFGLLKQLISELSDPNDIDQVATTILRLSGEYLDRGALFLFTGEEFIGLGGFPGEIDDRIRIMRFGAAEPSILSDVASSGQAHRGKIKKTAANVEIVGAMGDALPTEVVALPIMHNHRCIGILYGDNAEHRTPIDSMTGLEIFLSQAGYAFANAVSAWQKTGRGGEGT